jgi:ABC transport system ATP-binding/permease protein
MSLVLLKNVQVYYNTNVILSEINLQISKGDKLALIGNNRSGKSTMMKLISNHIQPDVGEIIYTKNTRIKYIAQEITELDCTITEFIEKDNQDIFTLIQNYQSSPNQHLHDEIEALQGFDYSKRLEDLYKLFKLSPSSNQMSELSGGQIKKIQLISALLFNSDLMLLDEPTNHLDIEAIAELEIILNQSQKAFLVISHDRKFLDNVCKSFIEIWAKRLYTHQGNYQQFIEAKQARLENEGVEEWKMKQYLKRELKWVNAGVQARGTKDKGRMARYDELVNRDKPLTNKAVDMVIPEPTHIGTRIIELEQFHILKDNQIVLGPINFKFEKEFKVGLIGANGSYKSTFIKALLDILPELFQTSGTIKKGINTDILYFEQDKSGLDNEDNVFNYISEGKERLNYANQGSISTYKYLDNWLFFKDQYNTQIKNLSGGEKSKLLLAKKLLKPTNFLILDEPTNDLDLDTIMLLESNLSTYQAPIILVSHDRAFLNHICNIIFSFDNGNLTISYGNYDDYYNKYVKKGQIEIEKTTITKPNSKDIRRQAAEKRDLEKRIAQLELTIKKIDDDLSNPEIYSDYIKTNELLTKKERLQKSYIELEDRYLVDHI